MEKGLKERVLGKLQKLSSRAEYCTGDIRRKALKALEGDSEAAEWVVSRFVEEKYVDDLRYASAFSREKASIQGWGPVKIRFQLRSKGISDDVISEALGEVDSDRASSRLEKLLAEKYRTLAGDPAAKLKLLKFGLTRGYDYDTLRPVVEEIVAPDKSN